MEDMENFSGVNGAGGAISYTIMVKIEISLIFIFFFGEYVTGRVTKTIITRVPRGNRR